ncbi:MAG TPA: hypothetical protein VHT73_14580 [Thermodesulfobacteriota bacterium]|nr:hypothetical protein [Thermodesulfobacteriota bacterium]
MRLDPDEKPIARRCKVGEGVWGLSTALMQGPRQHCGVYSISKIAGNNAAVEKPWIRRVIYGYDNGRKSISGAFGEERSVCGSVCMADIDGTALLAGSHRRLEEYGIEKLFNPDRVFAVEDHPAPPRQWMQQTLWLRCVGLLRELA